MKILNKVKQILQKPYPVEESNAMYFKNIAVVSLFVVFFLYVFEPFGISNLESYKFLICSGFGLMTFLASTLYEFGINKMFNLKLDRTKFTFGIWIINMIGLVMLISLVNFLFSRLLFGTMRWEFLPQMIYGTFTIGIFPVVIIGAISLFRQELKYQNIADEINHQKSVSKVANREDNKSIFDIPLSNIKYVESLQNYVQIGYVNEVGEFKHKTERSTIKGVLDQIENGMIVKCHRSFLVNRNAIESTSGNAQGLILTLSDTDKKVPVSRSFVPVFKDN